MLQMLVVLVTAISNLVDAFLGVLSVYLMSGTLVYIPMSHRLNGINESLPSMHKLVHACASFLYDLTIRHSSMGKTPAVRTDIALCS